MILTLVATDENERLISLAGSMVSVDEATKIVELIDAILQQGAHAHPDRGILALVREGKGSTAFNSLALLVNRSSRKLANNGVAERAVIVRGLLQLRERLASRFVDATESELDPVNVPTLGEAAMTIEDAIIRVYQLNVGRSPVAAEIDIWKNNFSNGLPFHEFVLLMSRGPEALRHADGKAVLNGASDGECVQRAYEQVQGRGAAAWEINHWVRKLEVGETTRAEMLASLFESATQWAAAQISAPAHDGLSCRIMGTARDLTADDWKRQALELDTTEPAAETRYANHFHIKREPQVLVSALASLYCGGEFIEQFMDNITTQGCFDDYCELVIVDADSPEDEYQTIKRYLARHKNINYIRMNYRIGIYDAWNVAAKAARGEYLTNTNMDDLRRHDSFERQAATLDSLPFVDVVYQDLYYTFDPRLSFERIAAFGHETSLPVITADNMIRFNSPHNAPMWRKRLHDEVGYFDTRYKSAGDYEFWLRCLSAGKTFYKINDPHVAYYQNPKGLSTRPDTRGVVEAMDIHRTYCRKLVSEESVMPTADFIRKLGPLRAEDVRQAGVDRYQLAQRALRNAARRSKYHGGMSA